MGAALLARPKPRAFDALYFAEFDDLPAAFAWLRERRQHGFGLHRQVTSILVDTPDKGRIPFKPGDWALHLGRGRFEILTEREFRDNYDLIGACE